MSSLPNTFSFSCLMRWFVIQTITNTAMQRTNPTTPKRRPIELSNDLGLLIKSDSRESKEPGDGYALATRHNSSFAGRCCLCSARLLQSDQQQLLRCVVGKVDERRTRTTS